MGSDGKIINHLVKRHMPAHPKPTIAAPASKVGQMVVGRSKVETRKKVEADRKAEAAKKAAAVTVKKMVTPAKKLVVPVREC